MHPEMGDHRSFSIEDLFQHENLRKISRWESLVPGYDRNVAYGEVWAIEKVIHPLLARLTDPEDVGLWIREEGGNANYFSCFLYPLERMPDRSKLRGDSLVTVEGIGMNFSLCAPVCVFGRTAMSIDAGSWGGGSVDLHEVLNPEEASTDLERRIVKGIQATPYILLTREQVSRPLPQGIKPWEYCLFVEPWDRVFHVLFAFSD